ncbi:MAG: hypothetical protein QNJ12_18185 [Ilumatobacter sp.]|uniref:hypothetical protein n=1 Tax=Ilumatobacter sp. TaxID=1967498 RepID=UPI00262FB254|nr:hypothetical protein [Ilumatobacter sp.]MDJ0770728.1 hypothetical protein [Ilumatobacter sp.]
MTPQRRSSPSRRLRLVIPIVAAIGMSAGCDSGDELDTDPDAAAGTSCVEPAASAAAPRLDVDLDGDARNEVVTSGEQTAGVVQIDVCASDPVEPFAFAVGNKPLQLHAIDIEGDGSFELLAGSAGGSFPFAGTVLRLDGTRLVDESVDIRVVPPGATGRRGESFACVDVDGNGTRELTSQTYEYDTDVFADASSITWSRIVVLGDLAGAVDTGTVDPAEVDRVGALVDATCGDETLFSVSG